MKPLHRPIAWLLLALYSAGCHTWRSETVSPIQLVSQDKPSLIRITTRGGTRVVVSRPVVKNDSVVGVTRGGPVRIGGDEIGRLEVRRVSVGRTVGLFLSISGALAVVGLLAAVCSADNGHLTVSGCVGGN